MRVLVTTTGSDGDIRPFLAFACELRTRGHEVLFVAPDHYAGLAAQYDMPFRKVGPPLVPAETARVFERAFALSNPFDQLAAVMDELTGPELEALPELLELVTQVDVVVYPPILVAAVAAARARQVPHVSVQLAPLHVARDYSPTGANLGRPLNWLLWRIVRRMLRRGTDDRLNAIVEAAGLPRWEHVLLESVSSKLLDLVAVSPALFARDPYWPTASQVTGYFFLDDPSFVVAPELEAFVGSDHPVVIGFGSMLGFDPKATTLTILEAVRDLDRKVIVQAGWAGLGDVTLPAHVHLTKFVPHAWLFSRAACVIHHGGAGTTAAALRAGVPQAIVWHLGDQPMWGRIVRRVGVSPGFVSHKKLSATWLRSQIDRMCADDRMRTAARSLGAKIHEENGPRTAALLLERAIARI